MGTRSSRFCSRGHSDLRNWRSCWLCGKKQQAEQEASFPVASLVIRYLYVVETTISRLGRCNLSLSVQRTLEPAACHSALLLVSRQAAEAMCS